MTTQPSTLTQNPIIQSEFRHQRFVIANSRSGMIWIALAAMLVIPSLLSSLYYTGFNLLLSFRPDLMPTANVAEIFSQPSGVLLVIMGIAMYVVVTMVSLGLASNSISREKHGKTWDNLRLTDIGARKIVWGKWWASLRALLGDQIMVAVIRLGLLAWIWQLLIVFGTADVQQATWHTLLLIILTFWYAVLDTALTAAVGILAALPENASGFVISASILTTRLVMTLVAVGWMGLTLSVIATNDYPVIVFVSGLGTTVYLGAVAVTLRIAQGTVG